MLGDGFTYRGKHSSEIPVTLLGYTIHAPELRENEDDVPGRHGVVDSGTELGKREIELELMLESNGEHSMESRRRSLVAWLHPFAYGDLVFDDAPDVRWEAKYAGKLGIEQISRFGVFTVTMKCAKPFGIQIDEAGGTLLDSDIILDSDVRLDDQYTFEVTTPESIEVNNYGTAPVYPIIEITGTFTTLTVEIGGLSLTYGEALASGTLIIDCDDMSARIGSTDKSGEVGGRIDQQLAVGVNTVQIGGTGLNCSVSFRFHPLYL